MERLFRQMSTGWRTRRLFPEMKGFIPYGPALAGTAILLLLLVVLFAPHIRAGNDEEFGRLIFAIDVAQIGASNAQNNVDPTEPVDLFARGDTAILSGTIYPKGKLQAGRRSNDPTEPGIGKYDYRAVYTGPPTSTPIVAFATELFQFSNNGDTLLTDGLWPAEGSSADRVVLGERAVSAV